MANVLTALFNTYTIQVLVDASSNQTGFRLSGPGLLGESYVTSPALTARILASPELREETGYDTPLPLEPLLEVYDNPTKDTNQISFFLARDVRPVAAQDLDETENIEVVLVPLAEVGGLILRGDVRVSGSVALCLLALRRLGA